MSTSYHPRHTATIHRITRHKNGSKVTRLLHATCDRCGREVTHGGGDATESVTPYLGHRVAHCTCPDGYYLVRAPDLL